MLGAKKKPAHEMLATIGSSREVSTPTANEHNSMYTFFYQYLLHTFFLSAIFTESATNEESFMQFYPEIQTPRGASLPFRLRKDSGDAWRTQLYPTMVADKTKEQLPILDLFGAKDGYYVVACDLDKLPYERAYVMDILENNCPAALVTQSVSGNPRAFFAVKSQDLDIHTAFDFLKEVVPEKLHPYMDKAGVSRLFVNERLYTELAAWLPTAPVTELMIAESRVLFHAGKGRRFSYHTNTMQKPEAIEEWIAEQDSGLRQGLIEILGAAWSLDTSFDLPTTLLAAQLETSPRKVGTLLASLQQHGWLRCIDKHYIPGKKAKSYRADSALWSYMMAHRLAAGATAPRAKKVHTAVIPGGFYLQALQTLWQFDTTEDFLAHVSKWDGITEIRLREANKYAKSHFRKRERLAA